MNSMAIKYLIFKLDFRKKKNRNKHKNGKEMRVFTHVVKNTPTQVLCPGRKAAVLQRVS